MDEHPINAMHAPIKIEFMLACYVSPKPETNLGTEVWNSMAGEATRRWLVDTGLCTAVDMRPTEKGLFWVREILDIPLPKTVIVSGRQEAA